MFGGSDLQKNTNLTKKTLSIGKEQEKQELLNLCHKVKSKFYFKCQVACMKKIFTWSLWNKNSNQNH